VKIGFGESELGELQKRNGGYRNPEKKAWQLSYRKAVELGLKKRVLNDELPF